MNIFLTPRYYDLPTPMINEYAGAVHAGFQKKKGGETGTPPAQPGGLGRAVISPSERQRFFITPCSKHCTKLRAKTEIVYCL